MTDINQAIARVQEFLPELVDIPDESVEAQLGAQQLADDVRAVFADRDRLKTRASEARALADQWRRYALEHHDQDTGWTAMAHACAAILTALDGGEPPDHLRDVAPEPRSEPTPNGEPA